MPQFDIYSFSSQVFWLLITFGFFYFFILRFYLARYAESLKIRSKIKNFSEEKLRSLENKSKLKSLSLYDFAVKKMLESFK
jgi:F0F1-type ATP synthase membrane subunit b/b'